MKKRIELAQAGHLVVEGDNKNGSTYLTVFVWGEVEDQVAERYIEQVAKLTEETFGGMFS